ncbi:MAG: hypothetical protein EA387_08580 [Nitriliruptor sp.]|nr:MAG: hypothetical protein EA387_08580 [Nitriliruptor sp.]
MGSAASPPPLRPPRRPSRNARRAGYLLAVAINLGLLWLVNVAPGWEAWPFLTADFARVVGFVNVSLLVGAAVNLGYVVADPEWAKRLGDAVTAAIALGVLLQLLTVFPFDLGPDRSGWETALRTVLALASVGTAIGIIASLAQLLRSIIDGPGGPDGPATDDERPT